MRSSNWPARTEAHVELGVASGCAIARRIDASPRESVADLARIRANYGAKSRATARLLLKLTDNMQVTISAAAFVAEGTEQFKFLTVRQRSARSAFDGPDVQFGIGAGVIVSLSYQRDPLTIQLRLAAGDSGPHDIHLVGLVDFGDHTNETSIAHETATTDRQMRRVVKQIATRTRATMW